ncbi:MAG: hypothetical protein K2X07_14365 [Caulobacteraceae bacterium]|nr:hypothetical protein [Caulobacteraceae bacterium]
MAKLVQPVLFSQKFGFDPKLLDTAGLMDPILNSDTKLFIDPLLIEKSRNPAMRADGMKLLRRSFQNVLELLEVSASEGDVAWRGAYKALNLDERSETGLGYGGASTSGADRPEWLRNNILRTAKEIITLGEKNPNVIPLMGLFEDGVGPDTLSDMTTNALLPALCKITKQFAEVNGIKVSQFGDLYGNSKLPKNPYRPNEPVLLVPRDVLRDLPLATDWADVSRVILEVKELRDAVNKLFGNWSKATVSERKAAMRKAAFDSPENMRRLLAAVANASESYDEKADLDGLFTFRKVLTENRDKYVGLITAPTKKNQDTLRATVLEVVAQFRSLVEDNNLWELLWNGHEPRHERAAQLLFFAVANVICAVNDVDISPETNSGGGPVDFKFSTGFNGRVLVEIKLSKGQVEHGYRKQLEVYKAASKNASGVFLVVDVGGMGMKLRRIQAAQKKAEEAGLTASSIEYVDARRRKSASKR